MNKMNKVIDIQPSLFFKYLEEGSCYVPEEYKDGDLSKFLFMKIKKVCNSFGYDSSWHGHSDQVANASNTINLVDGRMTFHQAELKIIPITIEIYIKI